MKIGIIGSGYVGLTTGICLASLKHNIFINDVDKEKLKKIQENKLPFFEKGLQRVLELVVLERKLIQESDVNNIVKETEIDQVQKKIKKISKIDVKEEILDKAEIKDEFKDINSSFNKINKDLDNLDKEKNE